MKAQMLTQMRKSVDVEKMPSVRVRPTLRVELKHRVMNCKVREGTNQKGELDLQKLNSIVLETMRKSKRAGLGGENRQMHLIESCHRELSQCKNLSEISKSIDKATSQILKRARTRKSGRSGRSEATDDENLQSKVASKVVIQENDYSETPLMQDQEEQESPGGSPHSPKPRRDSLYPKKQYIMK